MATSKEGKKEHGKGHLAMTPPIVSQLEWEAARQQLLEKEKALTRARDALAADRRRMPWLAVDKKYQFVGPKGKVSLLDLKTRERQPGIRFPKALASLRSLLRVCISAGRYPSCCSSTFRPPR